MSVKHAAQRGVAAWEACFCAEGLCGTELITYGLPNHVQWPATEQPGGGSVGQLMALERSALKRETRSGAL